MSKINRIGEMNSACAKGDLERVKHLVYVGVGVNGRDRYGMTPLCVAFQHGNLDLAKYLVSKGAIIQKKGRIQSPLYLACYNGHLELVKYAVSQGVDLDESTSLHVASELGDLELAKYLVEYGATINEEDDGGYNSLGIAFIMGNIDMMKFLIFHGADYSKIMEEDDYGYNYDSIIDHIYEDYCYKYERGELEKIIFYYLSKNIKPAKRI